jgi:cytochrome b subunit of formate dehydrogenase
MSILLHDFYFVHIFMNIFQQILGYISHNVPAVYDVLAARIRALRSKDQGRQNVGRVSRANERSD